MNSPASVVPADQMLRQYSRWTRLAWPLAIVAGGLAATLAVGWWRHPSLARVEQWRGLPLWWVAGTGATLLAALAVWMIRRNNLLHSAQRLDDRLHAKNRLETAAAYRDDAGALASAQREEAAEFLRRQPARQSKRFPLLAMFVLVAVLAVAHLVILLSWSRPWLVESVAAVKPAATPVPPDVPKARIKWKTPQSESKAVPIEEVPLQAVADSTSGLRDLVLELAVNGQPKLSVPIPADDLKATGSHPVQTSIYLDQLEVEPFDVVSYYLRAQRIDPRKLPETTSTVQFVQIKRFRDDIRETPGGEGNAAFALITALKVAQLRLVKENFVLAHTDLGQENEDWKRENGRVGGEQSALEKKTGEVVEQLIQESVPAEIVNLLNQARPFMGDAAQKIVAVANQPALTPQGRSLGLITELEKYMIKLAARDGKSHGSKPSPEDPFKDKQQFEMKQRFKTAAGELEMLAAAQAKLAEDLAKSEAGASPPPASSTNGPTKTPDPNEITGTPTERQTQISQRVGAILNGKVFNPEITGHLTQAHGEARNSLRYLDADDPAAAREPAATAARELKLAAEAMDRAGEEEAKAQLADAQSELNEAAEKARDAARQNSEKESRERAEAASKQAEAAARKLAEEARAQQETGSADAAKRLAEMAKAIHSDDTRKAMEKLRAQPRNPQNAKAAADRLQQLADHAAQQRQQDPLTREEIARLADKLESVRANMLRLAANDTGSKPGETGTDKPGGQPPSKADNQGSAKENAARPPGETGQQQAPAKGDEAGKQGQTPAQKPGEQGEGSQKQSGKGQGDAQQGQGRGQSEKEGEGQGQGKGQGQQGQGKEKGQGQGQGQGQGEGKSQGQAKSQNHGQGQGEGQGQGQATAQGRGQGKSPGQGQGQGGGTGRGTGESETSQGSGAGAGPGEKDELDDTGDTYGTRTGELQRSPVPPAQATTKKPTFTDHAPRAAQTRDPQQAKERFARELIEEVREGAQTAAAVVPGSEALAQVRDALRDVPVVMHYADRAAFFAKIDPALLGLIHSLRAQEKTARREHQLTEKNADQAPPAYRPAVSEYFEQLSRDYSSAPSTDDTSKE